MSVRRSSWRMISASCRPSISGTVWSTIGEVEGLSAQRRGAQLGQRLPTIAGRLYSMTPSAQPLGEQFARRVGDLRRRGSLWEA